MAKSAKKSDRIVIRLESEMRAKLHAKASVLGLDDAAYVRMLIYGDVNGADDANGLRSRADGGIGGRTFDWNSSIDRGGAGFDAPISDEPEPLPVEEMDIPPDADGGNPGTLDDLLRAGPSILDEMMALSQPAPAPQARQIGPQRSYRAPMANRSFDQRSGRGVQPFAGPGSMTRAIGVNDWAIGTNTTGDGRGNVVRDNMRHFGIVGTRSR